jgi:hypothetical protein
MRCLRGWRVWRWVEKNEQERNESLRYGKEASRWLICPFLCKMSYSYDYFQSMSGVQSGVF